MKNVILTVLIVIVVVIERCFYYVSRVWDLLRGR